MTWQGCQPVRYDRISYAEDFTNTLYDRGSWKYGGGGQENKMKKMKIRWKNSCQNTISGAVQYDICLRLSIKVFVPLISFARFKFVPSSPTPGRKNQPPSRLSPKSQSQIWPGADRLRRALRKYPKMTSFCSTLSRRPVRILEVGTFYMFYMGRSRYFTKISDVGNQ